MAVERAAAARARLAALVLAAAALAPPTLWRLLPDGATANDASDYRDFYEPVARSLLAGRGLVVAVDTPAVAYPPGFPLLVAAALRGARLLRLPEAAGLAALSVLGVAAAAGLLYLVARNVFGARPALLAAGAWIAYPPTLWLTKQPNSELPFMVALYAAVYAFWTAFVRPRPAPLASVAAGLLVGIAMLIRSIALGLGVVLAFALFVARRDLRPRVRCGLAAALLLGNAAAVSPWLAWVYAETGRVVPLSTGGAPSIRDGLTFAVRDKGYRKPAGVAPRTRRFMERLDARVSGTTSLGVVAVALGAEVRADPRAGLELLALKATRSWYGTDSMRHERALVLVQLVWIGGALWASRVALRRGGRARRLTAVVWLCIAYFWAMTILVLSVARYMVPATGLLFLLLPVLLPVRGGRLA
jgi:4-amino-4-deoxy-L-arabinose transferase-like glycosyltransferase